MSALKRLLTSIFGESAPLGRTSENESRPMDASKRYQDLVKYICGKQLTRGEERIPRVPAKYRDLPIGLLVAGFAQEKHPNAISQHRSPTSEDELQFAIGRLQRVADTPYVLPEFEKYFMSLDKPEVERD